jgi:flagella basal body P-ring formation protein FlgA
MDSLRMTRFLFTLVAAVALTGASANAAELRVRSECRPLGALVRLGDVAEVIAADDSQKEKLTSIPLFPLPGAGQSRVLRVRELLEILELRSVDLADCRISGASVAAVHGPAAARPQAPSPAPPKTAPVPNGAPVAAPTEAVVLAVAAVRPVERGQVIQAGDVQLAAFPAKSAGDRLLHEVEFAVGQEAARSFAPGQPIDPQSLRPPILVRRRDRVRVLVLAPGVRVTTDGLALADGAQGEWVQIETRYSSEKLRARVCGPRQVEVYAGGAAP